MKISVKDMGEKVFTLYSRCKKMFVKENNIEMYSMHKVIKSIS